MGVTQAPPMTVQQFQQMWRHSALTERSAAQQHFLDLCRLLGMPTPAEVDQEGSSYTFEKGAQKTAGGQGFADVWCRTTSPGSTRATTPT